MTANVCGKCGSPNLSSSRFCARCGSPLGPARAAKQEEKRRLVPVAVLLWFLNLFPGLVQPKIVVLFALGLPLAGGLGFMGVVFIRFGAIFSGCAIAAFGLIIYWTVWTWMLNGYTAFPSEGLVEFDGSRWLLLLLVTALPIGAAALVLGL